MPVTLRLHKLQTLAQISDDIKTYKAAQNPTQARIICQNLCEQGIVDLDGTCLVDGIFGQNVQVMLAEA